MNRRKESSICLNCNKEYKASYSSTGKYCSNKCQGEFQHSAIIKKWKNKEIKGNDAAGNLKHIIRDYLLEKSEYKCSECGWGELNPYSKTLPLIADHINGNPEDSTEENLRIICPNCDSLTATYKALNRGNGRHNRKERYKNGKSF